jgi:hypothetical protein
VEHGSDLTTWTELASVVLGQTAVEIEDPQSPLAGARFYRAVVP